MDRAKRGAQGDAGHGQPQQGEDGDQDVWEAKGEQSHPIGRSSQDTAAPFTCRRWQ